MQRKILCRRSMICRLLTARVLLGVDRRGRCGGRCALGRIIVTIIRRLMLLMIDDYFLMIAMIACGGFLFTQ